MATVALMRNSLAFPCQKRPSGFSGNELNTLLEQIGCLQMREARTYLSL
jgi:hypothetical protein